MITLRSLWKCSKAIFFELVLGMTCFFTNHYRNHQLFLEYFAMMESMNNLVLVFAFILLRLSLRSNECIVSSCKMRTCQSNIHFVLCNVSLLRLLLMLVVVLSSLLNNYLREFVRYVVDVQASIQLGLSLGLRFMVEA